VFVSHNKKVKKMTNLEGKLEAFKQVLAWSDEAGINISDLRQLIHEEVEILEEVKEGTDLFATIGRIYKPV
jgi:hypothetical protein